jgi:hypothetical protein
VKLNDSRTAQAERNSGLRSLPIVSATITDQTGTYGRYVVTVRRSHKLSLTIFRMARSDLASLTGSALSHSGLPEAMRGKEPVCLPLPGRGEGRVRGEALTLVAFEDAEQRRASRGSRASTVRSTWRAAGAIVRVSTPAGLTEQRKEARRAVFVGAPFFAYFLWQDKESERPRGREAGRKASAAGKLKGARSRIRPRTAPAQLAR